MYKPVGICLQDGGRKTFLQQYMQNLHYIQKHSLQSQCHRPLQESTALQSEMLTSPKFAHRGMLPYSCSSWLANQVTVSRPCKHFKPLLPAAWKRCSARRITLLKSMLPDSSTQKLSSSSKQGPHCMMRSLFSCRAAAHRKIGKWGVRGHDQIASQSLRVCRAELLDQFC